MKTYEGKLPAGVSAPFIGIWIKDGEIVTKEFIWYNNLLCFNQRIGKHYGVCGLCLPKDILYITNEQDNDNPQDLHFHKTAEAIQRLFLPNESVDEINENTTTSRKYRLINRLSICIEGLFAYFFRLNINIDKIKTKLKTGYTSENRTTPRRLR